MSGAQRGEALRAQIRRLEAKVADLTLAGEIAAQTLETVYRERDPKNIAAKCAAERLRKALA